MSPRATEQPDEPQCHGAYSEPRCRSVPEGSHHHCAKGTAASSLLRLPPVSGVAPGHAQRAGTAQAGRHQHARQPHRPQRQTASVPRQEGRAGMPNQHWVKGRMSQRGREARPERPLGALMCSHAGGELSIVLRLCGPTEVLRMKATSSWCMESDQVGTSLGLPDFHKISAAISYCCILKAPCDLTHPQSLPPRPPSNRARSGRFLYSTL